TFSIAAAPCFLKSAASASRKSLLNDLRVASNDPPGPFSPLPVHERFSEFVVCPAEQTIRIREDLPFTHAAIIGCSVATGVGAVIRHARVAAGESVLVIGCGGVGLNVVQGARLAGARTIIACDMLDNKLAYARTFGATHTINAKLGDV